MTVSEFLVSYYLCGNCESDVVTNISVPPINIVTVIATQNTTFNTTFKSEDNETLEGPEHCQNQSLSWNNVQENQQASHRTNSMKRKAEHEKPDAICLQESFVNFEENGYLKDDQEVLIDWHL